MDGPFPDGMLDEIERFLADDASRPWGEDVYHSVFATGLFFPLQRQAELAQMMRWARIKRPLAVMEIGSDKGGGLYHWVKSLPTVRVVIACEIRGTPYAQLFERAFPQVKFVWLPQCSRDAASLAAVRSALAAASLRLDCLFIDGDKTKFLRDFDAYTPMMHPNGIVFMHDVQDAEPAAAFEAARKRGYHTKVCIDASDFARAEAEPRTAHDHWLVHWRGRSCGVGALYLGGKRP